MEWTIAMNLYIQGTEFFAIMITVWMYITGPSQAGGLGGLQPPQFLAKQLILSQPEGQIMPTTVLRAPRIFRPCDGPEQCLPSSPVHSYMINIVEGTMTGKARYNPPPSYWTDFGCSWKLIILQRWNPYFSHGWSLVPHPPCRWPRWCKTLGSQMVYLLIF